MEIDLRFTVLCVLASYAAVAALERVPRLKLCDSAFWRPFFATDVGWYLVAIGVTAACGPLLEGLASSRAALGVPGLEALELPWAVEVLIATVLYDLGTSAAHMLLHRYEVLWRLHRTVTLRSSSVIVRSWLYHHVTIIFTRECLFNHRIE